MTKDKPFKTIKQQIEYLKNDTKLVITNEKLVAKLLKKCNYFNLINIYGKIFQRSGLRQFKDGTTFEMIYNYYQFDLAIKNLFLFYLQKIERHIKTLVAYYFAKEYGSKQEEYLDINNYNRAVDDGFEDFLNKVISYFETALKDDELVQYKNEYGNVPIWVIINKLSFGQLTDLASCLKPELKKVICAELMTIQASELVPILKVLAECRNICAHDYALIFFKSEYLSIGNNRDRLNRLLDNNISIRTKSDLLWVILIFKYLLDKIEYNDFYYQLKGFLDELKIKIKSEEHAKLAIEYFQIVNNISAYQPQELDCYAGIKIDTEKGSEKILSKVQRKYNEKLQKRHKDSGLRRHRRKK